MKGDGNFGSAGEYERYFSEGIDETNLDYNPNIISREGRIERSKFYRTKKGGHGFEGGLGQEKRTISRHLKLSPYTKPRGWVIEPFEPEIPWLYLYVPRWLTEHSKSEKSNLIREANWELENAIREDENLPEISPKITNSFNY